ncbi:YkgJ family cysteine cluster protein [Marispirochaeta aestuarii]|uniref:YkgJ family cysteine cluster protein n=1 Tax=Marispirochaeta aestuarii TaxID=1963862 RepID=UPI0029C6C743|nr:YkgJ family cysteine cluster protein [Marispirochaeta aestuarii]
MMERLLRILPERARKAEKDQTKYLRRLRDKNPKKLDEMFRRLHDEVFADIDCLDCANCCKTISPRFKKRDIERIARHLNMHPKTFRLTYLEIDEDDDWVLKKLPCPFLGADNYCSIYEVRPKACIEYPHTNVKNMRGHLVIARKNLSVCPAVFEIVERLRKEYPL